MDALRAGSTAVAETGSEAWGRGAVTESAAGAVPASVSATVSVSVSATVSATVR